MGKTTRQEVGESGSQHYHMPTTGTFSFLTVARDANDDRINKCVAICDRIVMFAVTMVDNRLSISNRIPLRN
jgi:hypothetical protein